MNVARIGAALRWSLAGIATATLLYVIYAHVAQGLLAREYRAGTELVHFGVADDLARLEVRKDGLQPRFEGGRMRVDGAPAKPSSVGFLAPSRRLDPAALVRLRFRTRSRGVEVAVGLETAAGDRHVEIALVDGAGPALLRVHGDRAASGRSEPISVTLPESDARVKIEDRDAEHELALRFDADARLVVPLLDGVPLPPVGESSWLAGTMVRPWFGVRAREPGAPVDVEIAELEIKVLPTVLPLPARFEERFGGKVLDPTRWMVVGAPPDQADVLATPGSGGLWMRGVSRHPKGFLPAIHPRGPTFPLDDLDLAVEIDVKELHRAAFVVGFAAEWVLPWMFEVGVLEPGAGPGAEQPVVPFLMGHFKNGQFGFETLPAPAGFDPKRPIELRLRYDRRSRAGHFLVNGVEVAERQLDLLPYEEVRLSFGANFQESNARFDVAVKSLSLRR